jgi:hypothetical protein
MSSPLPPSLNPQQVSPVLPSVAQQAYMQRMQPPPMQPPPMQPSPMFGGNFGNQGGVDLTSITSGVRSLLQNIDQQTNPLFGLRHGLENYLRNYGTDMRGGNASPGIMGLQTQGPRQMQPMAMGGRLGGLGLSNLLQGQQIAQSGG